MDWVPRDRQEEHRGRCTSSKFLYISFYRNGKQVFINSKTNDPEQAYKQLLDAHGATNRGILVLASEAAKISYEQLRAKYIADNPGRQEEAKKQFAHLDKFFMGMKATSISTDVIRKYVNHRRHKVSEHKQIGEERIVSESVTASSVELLTRPGGTSRPAEELLDRPSLVAWEAARLFQPAQHSCYIDTMNSWLLPEVAHPPWSAARKCINDLPFQPTPSQSSLL